MSKKSDPLLKKLDILAEKFDALIMLIAFKEQGKKLLEGKVQVEQIQTLKKWNFSNEVIALLIGTTPDVVSVRSSEMKTKALKEKKLKQEGEVKQQ